MNSTRINELRHALELESISLFDLIEIEQVFLTLPDEFLRDERDNALASDMLDEIERYHETVEVR